MAQAAAFIPAALTIASAVMAKDGADEAAQGSNVAAQRIKVAKQFEAEQLRINAGQQIAAGQAAAFEQERQARLVASRQLALAAASGAGASDPTVVSMIARTSKEGSYRAAVALYQGQDAARTMRMAAAGKEYEGDTAVIAGEEQAKAYKTAGDQALLKGGSSLFAKYGMGGLDGLFGAKSGDSAALSAGADTSWLDAGSAGMGSMA
jgi:hypothetical protein